LIPPIDVAKLSGPAQKITSTAAPEKLQEMAARGIAPGIKPGEMVAILVILSRSERPAVKATAEKTLAALPEPLLAGALAGDLPPLAIDALARASTGRLDVLEKLLTMPSTAPETVEELAGRGDEALTELVATNEERLLKHPQIIERLYLNKSTRMSTADRLIDLAARNGVALPGIGAFKEAAAALQDELIPLPSSEPLPDDVVFQETQQLSLELATATAALEDTHIPDDEGKEILRDKFIPLFKRIAAMTLSQKIRRAMVGSKEERLLLVRDPNRLVASAVVRSPLLTENEIVMISRNRNIADEVLRIIGSTPELTKSYVVKKNLVENPKTPVTIATRMVTHLRESDLRQIAKSKNVTSPVQDAARRHLDRRKS
jgi:hypothetical protein